MEYSRKMAFNRGLLIKSILIIITISLLSVWLHETPPGLLGKADAVGYAVCHRIPSHSFFFGERQMPLCARCTGMYLGAFLALIFQSRHGKKGALPSKSTWIVIGIFVLAFAIDGINSTFSDLPFIPDLYTTENWIRGLTGLGMGLSMGLVIYPTFVQSIFKSWTNVTVLPNWKSLGVLILLSIPVFLGMVSENMLLLYPFAIISSGTIILLLTMIYTIVWTMLLKKENSFTTLKEAKWISLAGLATAILQIGIMAAVRFAATGTWQGFSL
jgi:uncharacterized membrane protein